MRERGFTAKEVAELIGVPYTTLDRWIAAGAVVPEVQAEGTGSRRRFTFRDLVLAELAHVLKDHHMVLEDIAAIAAEARRNWRDEDPGALLVSPDGGLVLGGLPAFGQLPLGDGWLLRDPDKPGRFGEILFQVDLSAIARRMQERAAEMGK